MAATAQRSANWLKSKLSANAMVLVAVRLTHCWLGFSVATSAPSSFVRPSGRGDSRPMVWLHNDQPLGTEYGNLYSPCVAGAGAAQLERIQRRFLNHVGVSGSCKCSKSAT